ncbi:hypothetical protein QL285_007870 [Trifolium repens]|nr:hypothetical protein QL285_007870 [Trifolium repens]
MEEDVGRTRLGRETRAHASAREDVAPRPKRGCHRQSPVPFQGRHDQEVGGSSKGGSRRRSKPSQDRAPEREVEDAAEGQENANPPLNRDEDDGQPPVVPE